MNDPERPVDRQRLARLAHEVHLRRDARTRFLPPDLLGEPAWDILLNLGEIAPGGQWAILAHLSVLIHQPLSATSRWLLHLRDVGLIEMNGERSSARLSPKGIQALANSLENSA